LLEPLTVAANCWVSPACTETDVGLIATEMDPPDEELIDTLALADFFGSALLTAVTVTVGFVGTLAGAVYSPVEETVP
jgi:hypothetical protein